MGGGGRGKTGEVAFACGVCGKALKVPATHKSHIFVALIRLSTTTHNLLTVNISEISSNNSEKRSLLTHLAPVVQRLGNAIQRISVNKTNHAIRWIVIYPVDSAIQPLNKWGLDFSRILILCKFPDIESRRGHISLFFTKEKNFTTKSLFQRPKKRNASNIVPFCLSPYRGHGSV